MSSSKLINKIAELTTAKKYLEIGVCKGSTFLEVSIDYRIAVDPDFQFDTHKHINDRTFFFNKTSDLFFYEFSEYQKKIPYSENGKFLFDIIFIDGLHTFEQSYKDFINSIKYSHNKTIWILDDTIPWDPFSAHPDQRISLKYRSIYGFSGVPWHGDVFKTVFAIHEFHPEFSYATHYDGENAQTVIWKTQEPAKRKNFFDNNEDKMYSIKRLALFDLYEHIYIVNPVTINTIYNLIGNKINDYNFNYVGHQQLIRPLKKLKDNKFYTLNKSIKNEVLLIQNNIAIETNKIIKLFKKDIATLKNTIFITFAFISIFIMLILMLIYKAI